MSATIKESDLNKKLLIALCFFSSVVLITSYLTQYVWKIEPCRLCKFQRIPYFFLLFVSFLGLLRMRYQVAKIVILCLLSANIILSTYHLLVIGGILKDFCAVPQIRSMNDFMNMLESHVPCSKAEWTFLKLPLAAYNLVFSSVFLFFTTKNNVSRQLPRKKVY